MKKLLFTYIIIFISFFATAQCYKDLHSTNAYDGWMSCSASPNPAIAGSTSNWILYNFGTTENLFQSQIWNVNHPDYLNNGIENCLIHYSLDSINWSFFGLETFTQATGNKFYEGDTGPNFGGIEAKYLLITATSNYGGNCFGFGEIKIYTEPEIQQAFQLNYNFCETAGIQYNLTSNLTKNGIFTGTGVFNSYDDKFSFAPNLVGAGNHNINYTYQNNAGLNVTETATITVYACNHPNCNNCSPCGTTPQFIFDADPIPNGTYLQKQITTKGNVHNFLDVNLKAEQFVEMQNDFNSEQNLNYLAAIKNCDDSNLPVNLLQNGGFENGVLTNWNLGVSGNAIATGNIIATNCFEGNLCYELDITFSDGSAQWHIQLVNQNASVEIFKEYIVKFAAKVDSPEPISLYIGQDFSPWVFYDYYSQIPIDSVWQQYTFTFTASENNANGLRIAPQLGNTIGANKFYFDAFEMYEKN